MFEHNYLLQETACINNSLPVVRNLYWGHKSDPDLNASPWNNMHTLIVTVAPILLLMLFLNSVNEYVFQFCVTNLMSSNFLKSINCRYLTIDNVEFCVNKAAILSFSRWSRRRSSTHTKSVSHVWRQKQICRIELEPRKDFNLVSMGRNAPSTLTAICISCEPVNSWLYSFNSEYPEQILHFFNVHITLIMHTSHLCLHANIHSSILILIKVVTMRISGSHRQIHRVILLYELDGRVEVQRGNGRNVKSCCCGCRERQVRVLHCDLQASCSSWYDLYGATLNLLIC